ncbi:MAG: YjdF family protein [Coprobacillaceae bacterium]
MDKVSMTLRVLFVEPFWIGVIERIIDNQLEVCKTTFGVEPKDQELLQWIANNYSKLLFSPAVDVVVKDKKINPKRKQREVHKEVTTSIGTKSQQALKLQQVEQKQNRKDNIRLKKQQEKEYHFQLKQRKRKEKHKGH